MELPTRFMKLLARDLAAASFLVLGFPPSQELHVRDVVVAILSHAHVQRPIA